ncbi:MAG: hypothetical protein LUG66_02885 [Clostridiales bacterium]|nr:hypothetical protein [Clostridiales bacterium]
MKKLSFWAVLTLTAVLMLAETAFARIYGGTVLYSMTPKFSLKFITPILFGVIDFAVVKRIFKDKLTVIASTLVVFFVFFFAVCYPTISVYSSYYKGKFTDLAGTVSSFQSDAKEESFVINGVVFENYVGSGLGYDLSADNGGVVTGDGQLLYIRYVEAGGRNVICYIENVM